MLGYLFFAADAEKTDLPYPRSGSAGGSDWYRVRNEPIMDTEGARGEVPKPQRSATGFVGFQVKREAFSPAKPKWRLFKHWLSGFPTHG